MSSTIAVLKQLIQLEEKRSRLSEELASLDSQVASLKRGLAGNGSSGAVAAAQPKKAPGRKPQPSTKPQVSAPASNGDKGPRGGLAERILSTLKAAGSKGIAIKDIAEKTNSGYRNIAVWFATTGKKNKSIKKVAPATYRLA
jgi:hypothetical protein